MANYDFAYVILLFDSFLLTTKAHTLA